MSINFPENFDINSCKNNFLFERNNNPFYLNVPPNFDNINNFEFDEFDYFIHNNQIIEKEKKNPFKVIYNKNRQKFKFLIDKIPDKYINQKQIREIDEKKEGKKNQKLQRRNNQDNIRKKIKKHFIDFIFYKLNNLLNKLKGKNIFYKLPPKFISDVTKKGNKIYLDYSLKNIIKESNLYKDKYISNYNHNLNVLKSLEKSPNLEIIIFLDTKYRDLFDEYVHSDEYVDNIIKLDENKESLRYIGRYIYLCNNWNNYFSEK